ncbi:MAG6410 family transglutaminase-related lipoprotein [Ureaplasma diversum]|uniref:Transglutaminase-like domain-containing protein n=1 Tax=Ureaplasma diversum NCTC 246 TaxID=1188241 RepID=A0A084F1C0_9BACT|nr:transglutaminase domain-containing protein [Ureaplasma diversum]KEZ24012.1 Hypothetical protein, predicted lipoprotein [Ureaplasma diversum NCTC 246]
MKTKKKVIISALLCSAVLVPIVGLIASCNNEQQQQQQQQSVNQNQVLIKQENNTKNTKNTKTKSNLNKTSPISKEQPKVKSETLVKKSFDSNNNNNNNSLEDNSKTKSKTLVNKPTTPNQNNNSVVVTKPENSQPKQNNIQPIKVASDFYPKQTQEPLAFSTLNEQEIKARILSTDQSTVSYYSHPDFRLKTNYVILLGGKDDSKRESTKLELLTKDNEPVDGVRWFIRTRYPTDDVFSSEANIKDSVITLKKDGTVTALSYDGNDKAAEVWAEYKGYLYKVVVRVYSDTETLNEFEIRESKKVAKEIVKDWHHLSNFQKALKAYEWLTKNVRYEESEDPFSDQTAYSALVKRASVCTGYSKGYKMLLDELGVPCTFITGRLDHQYHIWNVVEIEGKWYHVDATWGARSASISLSNEQETTYNYFLIRDEDFAKGRTFTNPYTKEEMGTKYRAAKMENFTANDIDVKRVIHKTYTRKNEEVKWLTILTQWQYRDIEHLQKIVEQETKGKINQDTGSHSSIPENFNQFRFIVENLPDKNTFKKENLTISAIKNNSSNYIIKIEANKDIELGLENIEVENAFIDKLEKTDDGYLVYLTNFDNPNEPNKVKIDIFKIGYDFTLDKSELTFNVLQQPKPNAVFKALSNSSAILTNVDSSMQYRTTIGKWIDINSDKVELNDIGTLGIWVRKKPDTNHMLSYVQHINVSKGRDIDKDVKYYNNQIIGVDSSMQYRLVNSSDWKEITTNRLSNLKPGTYEVRIKPNGTQLASDPVKVVVS